MFKFNAAQRGSVSYDPQSDLVILEEKGTIESFDELGEVKYGVILGDNSFETLEHELDDVVEFRQSEEFDIVVLGTKISVMRER